MHDVTFVLNLPNNQIKPVALFACLLDIGPGPSPAPGTPFP